MWGCCCHAVLCSHAPWAAPQIKRHPFFAGFDWDQLERAEVRDGCGIAGCEVWHITSHPC